MRTHVIARKLLPQSSVDVLVHVFILELLPQNKKIRFFTSLAPGLLH